MATDPTSMPSTSLTPLAAEKLAEVLWEAASAAGAVMNFLNKLPQAERDAALALVPTELTSVGLTFSFFAEWADTLQRMGA